jgi:hypothetical protein
VKVLALVVASCALLWGCRSGPKYDPVWQTAEVAAPSENVLWAVAGQEMQRLGFPVGSGADPSTMVMRSGWRTELAPFRGEGYRELAEVRFTRVAPQRYRLEARVVREINMDVDRPIDPRSAKWEEAPDEVERSRVLVQRIRARLGERIEVGPERRATGR